MTVGPVLAAVAAGLVIAGAMTMVAALLNIDLLPPEPVRRRRSFDRLRSRRTLAEGAAAVVVALVAWAATGWPIAALGGAVAAVALPRMLSGRAAQRRLALLEAMEAWTRQLADVLTAGRGIEDALLTTADDPPKAIAGQVTALRRRLEYRTPTDRALRAFADELAHPVGDTVAAALIIASELRGRGLHQVLTALADTVAKQVAMERQIDAERATHRTTALWVLVALGFYTAFALLNRDYVAPFGSLVGQMMLTVVAGLYAATFWWLYRLASAMRVFRFLPKPGGRRR